MPTRFWAIVVDFCAAWMNAQRAMFGQVKDRHERPEGSSMRKQ